MLVHYLQLLTITTNKTQMTASITAATASFIQNGVVINKAGYKDLIFNKVQHARRRKCRKLCVYANANLPQDFNLSKIKKALQWSKANTDPTSIFSAYYSYLDSKSFEYKIHVPNFSVNEIKALRKKGLWMDPVNLMLNSKQIMESALPKGVFYTAYTALRKMGYNPRLFVGPTLQPYTGYTDHNNIYHNTGALIGIVLYVNPSKK